MTDLSTSTSGERLKVLALEPYYGGSHKDFLQACLEFSRHEFSLATMEPRKWKWRMRGSAMHFAEEYAERFRAADVILASDFVNLAELFGLLDRRPPSVIYFHENQLTYPARHESERDFHFCVTNITSALAADAVVFNSDFHRRDFLSAARRFLRLMPDYRPRRPIEQIAERSSVVYPGVEVPDAFGPREWGDPPVILYNHRWEYDKGPDEFFGALEGVAEAGHDFRLAVAGQAFRQVPPVFERAKRRFKGRIIQFGHLEREGYRALLARADIVVSTAIQEFFGMAVAEAVAAGAWPLVPGRLSYPEVIPPEFHGRCLFEGRSELVEKLGARLADGSPAGREALQASMGRFSGRKMAADIDRVLESTAGLR